MTACHMSPPQFGIVDLHFSGVNAQSFSSEQEWLVLVCHGLSLIAKACGIIVGSLKYDIIILYILQPFVVCYCLVRKGCLNVTHGVSIMRGTVSNWMADVFDLGERETNGEE